ncbi:MAG: phage tail protein, partial [Turicibacter sp.]|nr:phage tail protein [Turicibacter sp.]
MADLFIFDNHDRLVQVLSNVSQGAPPFWEARYKQILSDMSTFEFLTEAKVDVPAGHQVAFSDKDGMFRLFEITERVRNVGHTGVDTQYYCQDAMHDLAQNYIMDRRPQNVTLRQAAEVALEGQSRWQLGQVMDLGLNSTNYYRESSLSALSKLVERWGAEIRPRVEVSNGRIVGRFIDLVRIGTDTGLVLEVGHDVEGMEFSVTTDHIRTRMYGQGASLSIYDENGVPTGGNTRLIMFEDVQALPGDGFSKPLGQLFVEDEQARQKFGLVVNGQRQHREGMFSDGTIQDGRELMLRTWEHLQSNSHPHYHVQLTVVDLSLLEGEDFSHRRLSIGDMVRLVDHETFGETIAVESRVYSYEYDLADGTRAVIELGNFRDLYDNPELRNVQREVAAIRDRPALPSDGTNIIAPVAPITNFQATGLFASILLGWDSQRLGVQFELHASQVQGFLPGPFSLIYRGPVNMFTHASATPVGSPGAAPPPTVGNPAPIPPPGMGIPGPINPPGLGIPGNPIMTFNAPATATGGPRENQTWYYRVRAVNNAGLASAWSPEVSGQTANTVALDELESSLRGLEESVYQAYLRAGAAIEEADSAWWLAHDALMLASDEARISTIVRSETSGLQSEVVQMAGAWGAFVRDEDGSPLSSLLATRDIVDMRVNGEAGSTFFQVSDGRTVIRSDAIVLDGDTIVRGTFTVFGGNLADGSVTGVKIAGGAVTANHVAANAIAANHIASNAILTRHIEVGTLNGDRIMAGTITSGMLVAGTITTVNLANNAVTANQIANGSVTGVKIAGGAVAATHIAANAITANHIAAGAITAGMITAGTM